MQRSLTIPTLLVLFLGCRGPAATPMPPAADEGLGDVLHTLVVDSLIGGGRRSGQVYLAADRESDMLLRGAGIDLVPRVDASPLTCPGSTNAAGQPTPVAVGYLVRVRRVPQTSGALRLEVTVSCSFVFRGNTRGFGQGGTWELRRLGERWHIVDRLSNWIT